MGSPWQGKTAANGMAAKSPVAAGKESMLSIGLMKS